MTSAPRAYAERLLSHHGLALPVLVAYHDTAAHKPDAAPLLAAAAKLGLPPERCLYLGDEPGDARAAEAAGMRPIAVAWDSTAMALRSWTSVVRQVRAFARGLGRLPQERVSDDRSPQRLQPTMPGSTIAAATRTSRRYPWAALAESTLGTWSGDDLAILRYRRVHAGEDREVASRLVIDFKNGGREAAEVVTQLALMAIGENERYLRDQRSIAYLVAIPSSTAGRVDGPIPRLVERLAEQVPWLQALPPLARVTSVTKSATAPAGMRPTELVHRRSMAWVGPDLNLSAAGVIVLDDVITRGATSSAAKSIVRAATRARSVVGLFVARTVSDQAFDASGENHR